MGIKIKMKKKILLISSVVMIALLALTGELALAQEPTEELSVGAEVVERRTATSKHFYLGNEQYEARISLAPIHYRDAQGNWLEIDTTLRLQGRGVYAVEANGLRAYLPARSGGLVSVAGRVYPQAEPPVVALSETEIRTEEEARPRPLTADRTLPPVDVSLSWEPMAWRYADAAGHVDDLAAVQQVAGQVEGDTITYEGVMPQVNESYRVVPNGLKHQLTLLEPPRAPDGGLSGEITLDYVGIVELPAGLVLYANGAVQTGNFTTDDAIKVRDGEGHSLLLLMAPLAYEAENRQEAVGGSYAVWQEGKSLRLAWRTPAAWLLAPERRYPVVLDPTAFVRPTTQDAGIYERWPASNYGSDPQLAVGHLSSPAYVYRALVQWTDFSGIPDYALISTCDSCGQVWLFMAGREGSETDSRLIGLYDVTHSWTESDVTWNSRNSVSNWTAPGGDYDQPWLASHSVSGSSYGSSQIWSSLSLRDKAALWRTRSILGSLYGSSNYGLLLRYTDETGDEIKYFASKEHPSLSSPELRVIYSTGPRALAHQTPEERRVPSPDYYSIPSYSDLWQAVGIRMDNHDSDYNLRLYDDADYTTQLALSGRGKGEVDFIAIDRQAPGATRYLMTYSYGSSETGNYQIEYVRRNDHLSSDGIHPDDSYGPYTMDATVVIRLYAFSDTEGERTCISVNPTSGNARLGVAVFAPGSPPDDYYFSHSDALARAVASAGGDSASIDYTASSSGRYGLVVWNQSGNGTTEFIIEGCTPEDHTVFLPIILKNF